MTTFDNLTSAQKARAALHRDVRAICTETCHLLGLEVTKPAMEIIAELLYRKISLYGYDLEAFAKHSKRSTINSDDVKLLGRRNPSLKSHLNAVALNTTAPKKRQKSSISNNKQIDTPAKCTEDASSSKDTDSNKEEIKENGLPPPPEDFVENMVLDNSTIDLTFE